MSTIECPRCGYISQHSAHFCYKCGLNLDSHRKYQKTDSSNQGGLEQNTTNIQSVDCPNPYRSSVPEIGGVGYALGRPIIETLFGGGGSAKLTNNKEESLTMDDIPCNSERKFQLINELRERYPVSEEEQKRVWEDYLASIDHQYDMTKEQMALLLQLTGPQTIEYNLLFALADQLNLMINNFEDVIAIAKMVLKNKDEYVEYGFSTRNLTSILRATQKAKYLLTEESIWDKVFADTEEQRHFCSALRNVLVQRFRTVISIYDYGVYIAKDETDNSECYVCKWSVFPLEANMIRKAFQEMKRRKHNRVTILTNASFSERARREAKVLDISIRSIEKITEEEIHKEITK